MTTLAERRKVAIKTHETKTRASIRELETIAASMRVVGLASGAEKLEGIVTSMTYDLMTLMSSASVNSSS